MLNVYMSFSRVVNEIFYSFGVTILVMYLDLKAKTLYELRLFF